MVTPLDEKFENFLHFLCKSFLRKLKTTLGMPIAVPDSDAFNQRWGNVLYGGPH